MAKNKKKYIVDTNVLCMARERYDEMTPSEAKCAMACINFITEFMKNDYRLVLDKDREILGEYERNINTKGQPTLATIFMKWIYEYISKAEVNDIYVDLLKREQDDYETFPINKRLREFDNSDKKFVALANAHPENPPIVQGTDCKWWGFRDVLAECGIQVDFLCEEYIIEMYKRTIVS